MQGPPANPPLFSNVQQIQQPQMLPDTAQYGQERQEQQARDLAPYLGTIATSNAMGWTGQR